MNLPTFGKPTLEKTFEKISGGMKRTIPKLLGSTNTELPTIPVNNISSTKIVSKNGSSTNTLKTIKPSITTEKDRLIDCKADLDSKKFRQLGRHERWGVMTKLANNI